MNNLYIYWTIHGFLKIKNPYISLKWDFLEQWNINNLNSESEMKRKT